MVFPSLRHYISTFGTVEVSEAEVVQVEHIRLTPPVMKARSCFNHGFNSTLKVHIPFNI